MKVIIIIRIVQLSILLFMLIGLLSCGFSDWYHNKYFRDDKGRKYKRTRDGFKYY